MPQSLMQRHGIKARGKSKSVVTTDSKPNLAIAPNLLARLLTGCAEPNLEQRDRGHLLPEGWLYLTAVLDLFNHQVVGWSMRGHMQTRAVAQALRIAWLRRRSAPGGA